YARQYNIPLHVRSSFSQKPGTWIVSEVEESEGTEQPIISGVSHDRSEAKITVVGVPDKVGEAATLFKALADAETTIDMIVQNVSATSTSRTDISFTVPKDSGKEAVAALKKVQDKVGYDSLRDDDKIGKVSLIGAGMRSYPGVTARLFDEFAGSGTNVGMVSTSAVSI